MRFLSLLSGLFLCASAALAQVLPGRQDRFSFSVVSTLDETLDQGIFRLHMRSERPAEVNYELLDRDGQPVADAVFRFKGETVSFTDTIPSIRKWSAETPELYTLRIRVNGKTADYPVGFRQAGTAGAPAGSLLVNGQPVRLREVSLDGFTPGPARKDMLEELRRMKAANINAIRTGNAPLPPAFCGLCDSLGFYVRPGGADSTFSVSNHPCVLPPGSGEPETVPRWERIRAPRHPGYDEVRHRFQDISITGIDPVEGLFSIRNDFCFRDLGGYIVRWQLERDGRKVKKGKLTFTTPAGSSETFTIRIPRRKLRKKGEYRLLFETVTARPFPALPKGTVVALDEVFVKDTGVRKPFKAGKKTVTVSEGDSTVRLTAPRAHLVFDKAEGIVTRYTFKGADVIAPDFGLRPVFPGDPAGQPVVSVGEGTLRATYPLQDGNALQADYTLLPGGQLKVSATILNTGKKPLEAPQTGFRFHVKENGFRYFGRGPGESGGDRCDGLFKSVYSSKASDAFLSANPPRETGCHPETRWLATGTLTVVADSLFTFHARRFAAEDLDRKEVPERDFTETGISAAGPSLGFTLVPARAMKTRKAIRYAF